MTINRACNWEKTNSLICPMSPLVISLLACQSIELSKLIKIVVLVLMAHPSGGEAVLVIVLEKFAIEK